MRVTYYLFRETVTYFAQVWKDGGAVDGGTYERIRLRRSVPFEAEAYLQANKFATPDWVPFVLPYCEGERLLRNQSNSFILLLKTSGRVFAITFGHGFSALDRGRLEPDFGLRVTLNSVNPERLRSLQSRNIDPTTVSKQLVVNHDSPLTVFDVDFYQDLLAKLEGVPADPALGTRMAGADACYLTADVQFLQLAAKCDALLRAYRKRTYRKYFSFIDQVQPVKDDALIAELDAKLLSAMKTGTDPALGFALPDIGAHEAIDRYIVQRGRWTQEFDDLAPGPILTAYSAHNNAAEDHGHVQIHAVRSDGTPVDSFTARQCAVFQTPHSGSTFVLTLNKWYRVEREYAKFIDSSVNQLSTVKRGFLPDIAPRLSEGAYNTAAANGTSLCCMDKKNIYPAGRQSAIEVCDLFGIAGEFVHVKRHTRSATLSHLLAQGSVSARLFVDDRGYREKFRAALPPNFRAVVDPKAVAPDRFTVVYAITAPAPRTIPATLPFFTKVNLLFHCREIVRMGYKVKLYHVHEL